VRLTTRKDGKGRNPSVEEGPIGLTASLSRAEGPANGGGPPSISFSGAGERPFCRRYSTQSPCRHGRGSSVIYCVMIKGILMVVSRPDPVELAVASLANRRCVHYSETKSLFCTQYATR